MWELIFPTLKVGLRIPAFHGNWDVHENCNSHEFYQTTKFYKLLEIRNIYPKFSHNKHTLWNLLLLFQWKTLCENSFLHFFLLFGSIRKMWYIFRKRFLKKWFIFHKMLGCVWLGWKQEGWKIGRGKYGGKCCFSLFGWGKKIRETENRGESFLSWTHFFYSPKLGGKWGGKSDEKCILHKYPHFITLTYPSHFSTII